MEERLTSPYFFAGGGSVSRMPQVYTGETPPAPESSGSSAPAAARALYAACAPPSARVNNAGSSDGAPRVGGGTATASSFHARPPPRNESIGELANAIGRSLAGEIAGMEISSKNVVGAPHPQGRPLPPSIPAPASERRLLAEEGSFGFLPHAAALAPAVPSSAVLLHHPHSGGGEFGVGSSSNGDSSGGRSALAGAGTPRHHQAWAEYSNEQFRAQGRAAAAQSWLHADAVHRSALNVAASAAGCHELRQQHPCERSLLKGSEATATAVAPLLQDDSEEERRGGVRFLDQSWTAVLRSAAGSDLLPFLQERESRALVLCGCGGVPMQKIRLVLEKYGRLYYLRGDFAARGSIFAGFFDLRSAAAAQANFSRDMLPLQQQQQQMDRLSALPPAAAYFSVMLHSATAYKEGTLVVRDLPPHVTEGEVLAAFQAYGSVRGVCKQISLQPGRPDYFYIDYFDIQDAKYAADGLRAANPWCQRIGVEPAVHGDKERMQAQQLVAMLMGWREEMRQATAAAQRQQHGAFADYAACRSSKMGGPGCVGDGCGEGRYGDTTPATSANTTPSTTPGSTPPSGPDTYPAPALGAVPRQQSVAVSAASMAAAAAAGRGRGNITTSSSPPQQQHRQQQQHPALDTRALISQQQSPAQHTYANGGVREHAGNGCGNGASFLPAAASGLCAPPGYFASDFRRNSGAQPEDDVGGMFSGGSRQHGGGGIGYYHSPSYSPPLPHSQQEQHQQPQPQQGVVLHDNSGSPSPKPVSSPTGPMIFSAADKAALDRSVGGGVAATATTAAAARREFCGTSNGGGGGGGGGGGQSIDEFGMDLTRIGKGADKRTTIMIRNIPNKYTQAMLLREIDANFREAYDFFYLPIDFKNKCNVGYAFINFMDFRRIVPFFREFNGQRWKNFNSEKVCAITYARIQGKASMISRFQNSSLMEKDGEYRPLLFCSSGNDKGRPEPFPIATKARRSFTPTCHAGNGAFSVVVGDGGPGVVGSGAAMLGLREGRDMSGAGIIGGGSAAARECRDRERARSSSAAPTLSF